MKIIFLALSLCISVGMSGAHAAAPRVFGSETSSGFGFREDILLIGGNRNCEARDGGASWYGPGFHGNRTANGERFNQNALTAAHKTIMFDSLVRVTYRDESVVVRINDAGPYVGDRVIDLSRAAAQEIGLIAPGHGEVEIDILRCGDGEETAEEVHAEEEEALTIDPSV